MALAMFQNEGSTIAQEFAARLLACAPPDQKAKAAVISDLVTEIHKFMLRYNITPEQFRGALKFFEEIGEFSDARRQELVLLADVFGLSALAAEISNTETQNGLRSISLFAPFYRPDAPELELGADICLDGRGEELIVNGQVTDLEGGCVPNALVEVWHANADGVYENQEPDKQPEFNLRGKFRCDINGRFFFRTIKPKGYALPEDGPVGRLFNELGYPLRRPAHVNFKVSAATFSTVTIEYFDRSDAEKSEDAMFHLKPELMTDITLSRFNPRQWAMSVHIRLMPKAASQRAIAKTTEKARNGAPFKGGEVSA